MKLGAQLVARISLGVVLLAPAIALAFSSADGQTGSQVELPIDSVDSVAAEWLTTWKRLMQQEPGLAKSDGFETMDQALHAEFGVPYRVFALDYERLRDRGFGAMTLRQYTYPVMDNGNVVMTVDVLVGRDGKLHSGGSARAQQIDHLMQTFLADPEFASCILYGLVLDWWHWYIVVASPQTTLLVATDERAAAEMSTVVGEPVSIAALGARIADYVDRMERMKIKKLEHLRNLRNPDE